MNSDVPQPIAQTRSPGAGSGPEAASAAAAVQISGCEASSRSIVVRIL